MEWIEPARLPSYEKDRFVPERPDHGLRQVLYPEDLNPGAVYIRHFMEVRGKLEILTSELVVFERIKESPKGSPCDLACIQGGMDIHPVPRYLTDLGLVSLSGLWIENSWLEYIGAKVQQSNGKLVKVT